MDPRSVIAGRFERVLGPALRRLGRNLVPGKLVERALGRLGLEWFTRTLIFWKLDLSRVEGESQYPDSFRLASISEVERMSHYEDGWFNREAAILRLRQGCQLFIFQTEGQDAFYSWSDLRSVKIGWFHLKFAIPEHVVYVTGLYTFPALRGRGIAFCASQQVIHYWRKNNFSSIFVVIDPRNTASIRLHEKLGFQPYQKVEYKRRGFLKFYYVEDLKSGERRTWLPVLHDPQTIWNTFWGR